MMNQVLGNRNEVINVYITGKFLDNTRYIPLLFPFFGELTNEKRLFADRGNRFLKEKVFNLVKDISVADFILLPHDFFDVIKSKSSYLSEHIDLSVRHKKRLLIFDLSDYTDNDIVVPNSIIFRIASYGHNQKNNNGVVIMPTFVEDLSEGVNDLAPRQKSDIPSVGFCGWAGLKNYNQRLRFTAKVLYNNFQMILKRDDSIGARKQGIYFRMKAIKALKGKNGIRNNFIIRRSYSSHEQTIELSPEDARRQFIENIIDSDFTLCVRGDANISCRFYETLSLGRIPLFINTDCVLPLENVVPYNEFVLFFDHTDLKNMTERIKEFYKNLTNEDFIKMQIKAKMAFEKYLNVNSFFKYILPILAKKAEYDKFIQL